MRIPAAALIPLVVGAPFAPALASQPIVAVFDVQDTTGKLKSQVPALTDYLRTKLAETKAFVVVDKSEQEARLKKIIAEQKLSSYKVQVDEAAQIPLGQELAANVILLTKISRLGTTLIVSSELIDVAT